MSNTTPRPEHLPDFLAPPLNEVVLGVQFNPPKEYQQIRAGEVWDLFRAEYPTVQEQPPLPPAFETFGLSSMPSIAGQLKFITGASHDRFWFLRPDGDELIQFQQDRLLHNWRKVGDATNEYPRFEIISKRFRDELKQLQEYLIKLAPQTLTINQCEISYINHIAGEALKASDWLRFLTFDAQEPDDFSVTFRETYAENGSLRGRLICEASSAIKADGQRIIILTLTVRGGPKESDIDSALEFISKGRDLIVSRFTEFTTEIAHKKWRRVK